MGELFVLGGQLGLYNVRRQAIYLFFGQATGVI